jgi:PAS domain S-box-containing protein
MSSNTPIATLPTVESIIDRSPLSVTVGTPVTDVIALMSQAHSGCILLDIQSNRELQGQPSASCVLVEESGRLVGVFTEADVVRLIATHRELSGISIAEVMSQPVITLTYSAHQTVFAALSLMQQHHIRHLPVVDEAGCLIGLITSTNIWQALQPGDVTIAALQQHLAEQTSVLENAYQHQLDREWLIAAIAQRIRQSLRLDDILQTTVTEVRQWLQTDRVIIFRFAPDWTGTVVTESVGANWSTMLLTSIRDPCFAESFVEPYRQGRVSAINDTYSGVIAPCHLELLEQFQVRANLIVPILQGDQLWGLLVAHHCAAPRQWQSVELELLKQLATQVAIAIQQSMLFEQAQSELVERQQVEIALRQSEQKFRAIFDGTFQFMGLLTTEGVVIEANRSALEAIGAKLSEVKGNFFWTTPWWTHFPQQQDQLQQAIISAASGEFVRFEAKHIWADGTVAFVDFSLKPVFDETGQVVMLIPEGRDITDRVQLEAERKQAEQKIYEQAALLNITTDAICVCDLNYRILFWNQSAERLYGWKEAEVLEQSADTLMHSQSQAQLAAVLETVLKQGEWLGELKRTTKAGKTLIVQSRWTLMRDENGNPKSILTVDTDVTEKKQLEAQMLRNQRLESLGTLASGIAHDLNNVLTPILATAQLLPLKLPHLDPQSQQLLTLLESSSKRGAELVKQILSFTRGVEGKRTTVQLSYLLQEVVQVARSTFPKTIDIRVKIPGQGVGIVLADATHLQQVFMNLCVNARDAMPNEGTLYISAENFVVDEHYSQMNLDAQIGHYVVVSVADTGIGIPAEVIERIFEPFFTTKEIGKGTGLGLSTTLGIVKSHGGFVTVSSEVGKGSDFKVYLPRADDMALSSATDTAMQAGHGELILVVDDEAMVREITTTSLETYGYRVLAAQDGIEAIAAYAQHQDEVAAVLIDMMMPSMDGMTAIRTLEKINPRVKVIATSGLTTRDKVTESTGGSVKAFLSKPYTITDLLESLHHTLTA